MAAQFDVYAPPSGPPVVIIQSDLLSPMPTRVAVPLLGPNRSDTAFQSLTPFIALEKERYLLAPQLIATFTIPELGKRIGSVANQRDSIIRAMDALLGGI